MPVNPAVDPVGITTSDPWIALGILLFVLAMVILSLIGRGAGRVAPEVERLDQIDKRLTTHDSRLTMVEERQSKAENGQVEIRKDIARLPTKEAFDGLTTQVGEMRTDLRTVATSTEKAAHSVGRMEDFLMIAAADVISGKNGEKVGTSTKIGGVVKPSAKKRRTVPVRITEDEAGKRTNA